MTGRKHRATGGIGTAPGKATGWAVVPVTEEGRKLRPWGGFRGGVGSVWVRLNGKDHFNGVMLESFRSAAN